MAVPFPYEAAGTGTPGILQTHTFRDSKGFTAQIRYWFSLNGATSDVGQTAVQAILTALKALTNAAYQGSSGLVSEFGVKQYGTSGASYASVRQKARLVYQDSSGALHSLNIPSAKTTDFDADLQTVLPAAVATLNSKIANPALVIGSAVPFVSSRNGLPITNYMGGFFVARQTKKNKLFFLNGALTPSEPGD